MRSWMTSLTGFMLGIALNVFYPMVVSPYVSLAGDIQDVATEPARDPVLMWGYNERACLNTQTQKFHPGYRSYYGVYCVEYDKDYKEIPGNGPHVEALRPDKDWHNWNDGGISYTRKLSFDQFLQMQQVGYQLQQFYMLRELSQKFTKLQGLLENNVKAWQDNSMNKVIAEIENFPEEFSKNRALIDAVASAAGKNLSTDQQFMTALKEMLKK